MPSVTDASTLGDGLRIAREHSGRSLAELSSITRVPSRYLTALEQNDFSTLPNRVFSIGYVRAYAGSLGLDEQLAVERFRRESPDPSIPLQAPVGVAFEEVRRYSPRLIAAGLALVIAVVGWNVFQRVSLMRAPQPSDLAATPESWTLGAVPGQPAALSLSAPRPAPPDQTIPALYITPGLETELTGLDPASREAITAAAAGAPPVQRAFNPRGAIYGASASASQVVIQAREAAGLVVRMADGRVLFARQLAAGDAWRAPAGIAATIDASKWTAFDVYLNGEHGGRLEAQLTPLDQLNTRAQGLARQAASEVAARTEAARVAAVQAQAQLQTVTVQSGVVSATGG
ncbi:RodZ family helix-turn-helix domain-containing protein [Brevundimonas sp.]|uniref:helix-turn-helix domain-containing protein n=1 Tax=Brevundimonas sp. TaxID=1871086 RepID=UPI00273062D2|nr:helix-turn-helix domain-containing protein [Brevundimonas sp.]MDP1913053.1 helix-turn-helix domain-containing protein [Brevundimonas sp.]